MFAFYLVAFFVVLLGVVINIPGSIHINPILLHFYEPHKILFLTMAFLMFGALARVIVFYKHIMWKESLVLGGWAIVGGILGGYLTGLIPQKIIILIFFISGILYLIKTIQKRDRGASTVKSTVLAGALTAFFQSFGISAGTLRQGYLASRGYDLPTIHGTGAIAFILGAIATISTRLVHESFDMRDIVPIASFFPFMLLTVYLGKKIIYKIPKKIQDLIIIYSLILSLAFAVPYLFN